MKSQSRVGFQLEDELLEKLQRSADNARVCLSVRIRHILWDQMLREDKELQVKE